VQVVGLRRRGEQGLLEAVGELAGRGGHAGHAGELRGLLLRGTALGEVADGDDDAGHPTVLDGRDGHQVDRHAGAVTTPEQLVLGDHGAPAPQRVPHRALVPGIGGAVGAVGVQQQVLVLPQLLGLRVPGDALCCRVDELDPAFGVQSVDAVGHVREHPLVARQGTRELVLRRSHRCSPSARGPACPDGALRHVRANPPTEL
jgi:hypothetical protein